MSPAQEQIVKDSEALLLAAVRRNGHSYETFKSYWQSLRSYFVWLCEDIEGQKFKKSDPTKAKCEAYLTAYAGTRISASTQNAAHAALRYWYVEVLKVDPGMINAKRAKVGERVRTAPSVKEVIQILGEIRDTKSYPCRLIAVMMYACGLRVNETLSIRLKDIDLDAKTLVIHEGKGKADRFINLTDCLIEPLRQQARLAWRMHREIAAQGIPIALPDLLAKKSPKLQFSWKWMWLHPLATPSAHPFTGETVWWHCLDSTIQRAMADACDRLGMPGAITPHHLRHGWATHSYRNGAGIRDIQEILGHKDIRTTMRYITPDPESVPSPFERISGDVPNLLPFPKTA